MDTKNTRKALGWALSQQGSPLDQRWSVFTTNMALSVPLQYTPWLYVRARKGPRSDPRVIKQAFAGHTWLVVECLTSCFCTQPVAFVSCALSIHAARVLTMLVYSPSMNSNSHMATGRRLQHKRRSRNSYDHLSTVVRESPRKQESQTVDN